MQVDHSGRTCRVRWFRLYTAQSNEQETECRPLDLGETEEPVYDLRDHPDFQYRPGSIVIRVGNFEQSVGGNNATSSKELAPGVGCGGQVLDNYPSGQVLVRWADGREARCWPQDLYKLGEYDSDDEDGFWGDQDDDGDGDYSSDGSWETESEHSVSGDEAANADDDLQASSADLRRQLASHIDKLRVAIAKLEDLLKGKTGESDTLSANQISANMKQLVELHVQGKDLDSLLGTEFFKDENFDGLVEKISDRNRTTRQRVSEQLQRLNQQQAGGDEEEQSMTNQEICLRFCAKLKEQLILCHGEMTRRFGHQQGLFMLMNLDESVGTMLNAARSSLMQQFSNMFRISNADNQVQVTNDESEKDDEEEKPKEDKTEEDGAKCLELEAEAAKTASSPDCFTVMETAPTNHYYHLKLFQPIDPKNFIKVVGKEMKLLKSSLPKGIHVKAYEDRMDLFSILIKGPESTPYEDGLFLFDLQLSEDYPNTPPVVHYHSYCSDRLNPNLYEDGKVCVSLLGTWSGKGTETWNPTSSNLLQVLVSIQGLILVGEPYYNEAGYERHRGTQQGLENSRMYNEMVVLKLFQSMTRLVQNPSDVFKDEIVEHFKAHADRLMTRLEAWKKASEAKDKSDRTTPDFPLLPLSKGFCISLVKTLEAFKKALEEHIN